MPTTWNDILRGTGLALEEPPKQQDDPWASILAEVDGILPSETPQPHVNSGLAFQQAGMVPRGDVQLPQRPAAEQQHDPAMLQMARSYLDEQAAYREGRGLVSGGSKVGGDFSSTFRGIPESRRPEFLQTLEYAASERVPDQAFDPVGALSEGVKQVVGMPQNAARAMGMLSPEETAALEFYNQAEGIRRGTAKAEQPRFAPDDSIVDKAGKLGREGLLGALEMAPAMYAGGNVGRAAGGAAGMLGANATRAAAVGTGAGTAFWSAQEFPDLYDSAREMGVDEGKARVAAVIAAPLVGYVENLQFGQMEAPLKKMFKEKAHQSALKYAEDVAKELGKTYVQEVTEENLQNGIGVAMRGALAAMDEDITLNGSEELKQAYATNRQAMLSMPFMLAPGGAVQAAGGAASMMQDRAANAERLKKDDSRQSAIERAVQQMREQAGTRQPVDIATEARKWAESHDNPEAVAKVAVLADSETVSRGAFEEAVGGPLRIGDRKLTQDERGAFAKAVKDRLQEGANNVGPEQSGRVESVNDDAVSSESEGTSNVAESGSGVVGPADTGVPRRPDTGGGRAPEHGGTGVGGLGERSPAEVEQVWRATVPGAAQVKLAPGKSEMLRQIQESQGESDGTETGRSGRIVRDDSAEGTTPDVARTKPQGESNERPTDGSRPGVPGSVGAGEAADAVAAPDGSRPIPGQRPTDTESEASVVTETRNPVDARHTDGRTTEAAPPDRQPGDPQPTGVPSGLDPVAYRLGQKHSSLGIRDPSKAGMKPGTLPWKSWLAGYDSQKTPAGDSGTDTDVGTKPETQSDDAELDAAFDAAFGEKFGEDKKPSGSTKEVVPVEQPESPNAEQTNAENAVSATTPRTTDSVRAEQPNNRTTEQKARAAIESIDTSTRDGEFEAMTKVAEIANAHGVNPNELWRDVYFEPEGADRDIVAAEKPQPKRGILKRKPQPLETRDQIKKAYETGQIDAQQVLEAISKPADKRITEADFHDEWTGTLAKSRAAAQTIGMAGRPIAEAGSQQEQDEIVQRVKRFVSKDAPTQKAIRYQWDIQSRINKDVPSDNLEVEFDDARWKWKLRDKAQQTGWVAKEYSDPFQAALDSFKYEYNNGYWRKTKDVPDGVQSTIKAIKQEFKDKQSVPADAVGTSQAGEPVDVTGGAEQQGTAPAPKSRPGILKRPESPVVAPSVDSGSTTEGTRHDVESRSPVAEAGAATQPKAGLLKRPKEPNAPTDTGSEQVGGTQAPEAVQPDAQAETGATAKEVTRPALTVTGQAKPIPGRSDEATYVVHKRKPDVIPDTFKVIVSSPKAGGGGYLSVHGTGMTAEEAYDRALHDFEDKVSQRQPKPVDFVPGAPNGVQITRDQLAKGQIGFNQDGEAVYEDENGVRSVVSKNVRRVEPVSMVPTRAGVQQTVDVARRGDEFKTVEERQPKPLLKRPEADADLDSAFDEALEEKVKSGNIPTPSRTAQRTSERAGRAEEEGITPYVTVIRTLPQGRVQYEAYHPTTGKKIAVGKAIAGPGSVAAKLNKRKGRYQPVDTALYAMGENEEFTPSWYETEATRYDAKVDRELSDADQREAAETPKESTLRKKTKAKVAEVKEEMQDVANRWKKKATDISKGTKLSSGFDPELVSLTVELVETAIKQKVYQFADFVVMVRDMIGEELIREHQRYIESGWNAVGRRTEFSGIVDKAGKVEDVLNATEETRPGEPDSSEDMGSPEATSGGKAKGKRKSGGRAKSGRSKRNRPNRDTDGAGDGTGSSTESGDAGTSLDTRRTSGSTAIDFRIPADTELESGGAVAKFERNLAALRLLKELREEGRKATAEEQAVLAKQTGWGQFANYFLLDTHLRKLGVYDPRKTAWLEDGTAGLEDVTPMTRIVDGSERVIFDPNTPLGKRQIELIRLLTPEEYQAARRSTQFSHYTSPGIARSMWSWVERMIPADARRLQILEPTEGNGIFWGTIPDSIAPRAAKYGIEPDDVSREGAQHLYQSVKHDDRMFEDVPIPDGFYDIQIGNPPFAKTPTVTGIEADKDLNKLKPSLHNFIFLKAAKKARPGGLVAFIVTHHFMDAQDDTIRAAMSEAGMQLVGAVRLPNDAFGKIAGTKVTTDIVFLQKTTNDAVGNDWRTVVKQPLPRLSPTSYDAQHTEDVHLNVNEYYVEHPEHILGRQTANGKMHALTDDKAGELTVESDGRDLAESIREIAQRFMIDQMAFEEGESATSEDEFQAAADRLSIEDVPQFVDTPVGNTVWHDGALWVREGKFLQVSKRGHAARGLEKRAKAWFKVRDAIAALSRKQIDPDAKEHVVEEFRANLRKSYDAFVKDFGPVRKVYNIGKFGDDWLNAPDVWALESKYDKDSDTAEKADIFEKRTQWPATAQGNAKNAEQALLMSLQERGVIDPEYMARVLNDESVTPEELVVELGDKVYRDPATGALELAEVYLSGNVRQKLATAKEQAATNPEFDRNVIALEKIIPEAAQPGEIRALIGAKWIKPEQYKDFIADVLKVQDVVFTPLGDVAGGFAIDNHNATNVNNPANSTDFGVPGVWDGLEIFERTMNGASLVVKVYDERGRYLGIDEEATERTQDISARLQSSFADWAWADAGRAEILADQFNTKMRAHVKAEIPAWVLSFKGMTDKWAKRMRDYQKAGAARMVLRGNTFLAYVVGAGKTLTAVAGAMEARRLGVWKKPVAVVPNHLVAQWAAEIKSYYPTAKVLAASADDFSPKNRRTLFSRIKTGDWDFVVVPQSSFKKLSMTPGAIREFFRVQLADLEELILQERENDPGGRSPALKQLEAMKDNLEARMDAMLKQSDKDQGPYFEELGIDALIVDEAHEYKNLYFRTRHGRVPGINASGNQKTFDMLMKTDFLNDMTGGRALTFLSGTPISNSMAELWVMQRYLQAGALRDLGVLAFDDWKAAYGEVERLTRVDPLGRKFRQEDRFSRFVNLSSLGRLWRDVADVRTIKDIDIRRPPLAGGKPRIVEIEAHPLQKDYALGLARRAGDMPDDPRIDNILKVMSDGAKVSIDMRLLLPNSAPLGGSKLDKTVEIAFDTWKKTKAFKGTQLIWLDKGTPRKAKKLTQQMIDTGSYLMGELASGPVSIDEAFTLWQQAHNTDNNDRRKFKSWLALIADDVVFEEGDEDTGFNIGGGADNVKNPPRYVSGISMVEPEINEQDPPPWNAYQEIKDQLIARGVPASEIAFIHDADTDPKKLKMFADMNEGTIRIMLASTPKLGTGANVQERLIHAIHVDAPWRPSDLEQRDGRILRPGNVSIEMADGTPGLASQAGVDLDGVTISRIITKGSIDARYWQTLEDKQRSIEQFNNADDTVHEIEGDIGSVTVEYSDIKAMAADNPLFVEEAELKSTTRSLRLLKASFDSDLARDRNKVSFDKEHIPQWQKKIEFYEKLKDHVKSLNLPADAETDLTIDGTNYRTTDKAIAALDEKLKDVAKWLGVKELSDEANDYEKTNDANWTEAVTIGEVYGKRLNVMVQAGWKHAVSGKVRVGNSFQLKQINREKKELRELWEWGYANVKVSIQGIPGVPHISVDKDGIARLGQAFATVDSEIRSYQREIDSAEQRVKDVEPRLNRKFEREDEFKQAESRLRTVRRQLGTQGSDKIVDEWTASQALIDHMGEDHPITAFMLERTAGSAGGEIGMIRENGVRFDVLSGDPHQNEYPPKPGDFYVVEHPAKDQQYGEGKWEPLVKGKIRGIKVVEKDPPVGVVTRPGEPTRGPKKPRRRTMTRLGDQSFGDDETSAIAIDDTKQKFSAQRKDNADPISSADIIKTWERDFDVPIRRGKVGSKPGVQGIYKHLVEVVRLRKSEDVNLRVASHEVAHHVDQKTDAVKSMSKATKDVFGKLDYEPAKNRPKEGWAEFVSRYVMGEEVKTAYPDAYNWFATQWATAHPEMAAKLGKAARYAQQYANQGAFARAKMLFPGREAAPVDTLADDYKKAMQSYWNRSLAEFVDQNRAFYLLDEEFRKAGGKFRNREATYELKLATDFTAPAHAERAMLEGVHTVSQEHKILGPSIADALKNIKSYDDYQRAQAYAVALFTVEMADVKPGYNTGMRLDDAEFIIEEVEKNADELKRYEHFAKTLTDYNNALVEMAYDAGSITARDRKYILGKTKHYVPLHREIGGKRAKHGLMAGAGMVNLPPAFRRRSQQGSGLPIVDIVEATMRRTMDQYARAMKQQVVQSVVTTVDPRLNGGVKGLGKLAERLSPDMLSNVLRIDEALDDLVREGLIDEDTAKEVKIVTTLREGRVPSSTNIKWLSERYSVDPDSDTVLDDLLDATNEVADGAGLITYWRPSYLPNAGKNIVRLVVNGEPQMYQLDEVLFDAMSSMGQLELGAFGEAVKSFNHAFKTGAVGLSTGFGGANVVRDWWDAQAHSVNQGAESTYMPFVMLGKYAYAEVESLRSGGKAANEFVRLFKEYGGELTTRLGYDAKSQRSEKRKMFGGADATSYLLDHPIQSIASIPGKGLKTAERIITMTDVGPRLAEFVAVMKKNGYSLNDKGQIVNKHGDVTRPPRRVIVAAINAAGDATVNFKRVGRTMRKIDAYVPFTNAALQSRVRQVMAYKALGKGMSDVQAQRVAIMTLAFGALGAAAFFAYRDDDDNEERAEWLKGSHFVLFNGTVRVPKSRDYRFITNMVEAIMEDTIGGKEGKAKEQAIEEAKELMFGGGGVLREAFEQTSNYDQFREAPIESQWDARLHPWARYDEHTSLPARYLGNITGHLLGISPKRIDHLLDSTTGGMYRRLNRTGENLLNGTLGPKDIPVVNAFWMDKDYQQSLGDFYDAKWEAEKDVNTAKKEDRDSEGAKAASKTFDDYESLMTDLRAAEGEEPTGENEKYIIGLARAALGRESLDSYPNPLLADLNDLTPAARPVVQKYLDELWQTGYGETKTGKPYGEPIPGPTDTHETYRDRYGKWVAKRKEAQDTLTKRQGMLKRVSK